MEHPDPDVEFVKSFTPVTVRFPKFSILPKKCINCDNFGQKLRMYDFSTLENFTPAQKYFTLVPLVTKSMSVKLGKGSKE